MTLPAAGYLSNASRTVAEEKVAFEDQRDAVAVSPGGSARIELTIASGAIVPTAGTAGGHYTVDTEGDAASDDLTTMTLTNVPEGRVIRLYCENASRVSTIHHGSGGAGEYLTVDGESFVLDALDKWIEFHRRSTSMVEIGRNYGIDYADARAFNKVVPVVFPVLCPHTNLQVGTSSAAAISVTATAAVLTNTSGDQKTFAPSAEAASIASSGAGGLDTGAEAGATWYYIWLIGKTDGTVDAMFSLSATAPTMPGGYTYKGLVGAIYNNGSSDFGSLTQRDHRVTIATTNVLSDGVASSATSVSLAAVVPAIAKRVSGHALVESNDTNGTIKTIIIYSSSGALGGVVLGGNKDTQAVNTILVYGYWSVVLSTAQTIWYLASGGISQATINVSGWEY